MGLVGSLGNQDDMDSFQALGRNILEMIAESLPEFQDGCNLQIGLDDDGGGEPPPIPALAGNGCKIQSFFFFKKKSFSSREMQARPSPALESSRRGAAAAPAHPRTRKDEAAPPAPRCKSSRAGSRGLYSEHRSSRLTAYPTLPPPARTLSPLRRVRG